MTFDFYTGDNYFQTDGGSFWTDLAVNCLGAFVGFTLSLLIYRHQIKRDNRKQEEEKQSTYKAQLVYFAAVAETFIKDAKQQFILMNDYIKEQAKEPTDLKTLRKVPTYDFTRLLNNDNKDVLESWMKNVSDKDNITQYRSATGAIDKVEAIVQELHRVYHLRITTNYDKLFEVKTMVDHLPDRLSSIGLELFNSLGEQRHKDPFYLMVNKQIGIYSQLVESQSTLKGFMDKLVEPTLNEFYLNYTANKYTDEIATLCKKARVKFHEVEEDMTNLGKELVTFNDKIAPFISTVENFISKVRTFT
jgi:hypothetical protein